MAGRLIPLRNGLFDAIKKSRETSQYVISAFTLTKSYFPRVGLEQLTSPRVVLAPLGYDIERTSRARTKAIRDARIQVALQAKVDPQADALLDRLVVLYEQLMETAESDTLAEGF